MTNSGEESGERFGMTFAAGGTAKPGRKSESAGQALMEVRKV